MPDSPVVVRMHESVSPGTWVARVRREDCSHQERSECSGQKASPDLSDVVALGWLAGEDLLFGEEGKSLVPSPGLARARRIATSR